MKYTMVLTGIMILDVVVCLNVYYTSNQAGTSGADTLDTLSVGLNWGTGELSHAALYQLYVDFLASIILIQFH